MIRDMLHDYARNDIEPHAHDYNESGEYPESIIKELGGLGLFGMMVPEEYGGSNAGAVSYSLALQEIAYSCASVAVTLSVTNLTTDPLMKFASEEQKRRFLFPLASGEYLGAFALTEPGAGSNPSEIRTQAVKKGKNYIINGSKQFITNGSHAGIFILIARTSKDKNEFSAFIVPAESRGLRIGRKEKKMGLRASDTVEVILEDCAVPENCLIGRRGMGIRIALSALDSGRIGIASQSTGMIKACLDEALRYAGERRQFNKPIIRHQSIQNMISDIATEYEAAAMLAWSAASLKDSGMKFTKEASIAKLFASEAVNRCAYRALQVFGGYGYISDNKVERIYRDARVTTIYEGTSEVQRMVIARELQQG